MVPGLHSSGSDSSYTVPLPAVVEGRNGKTCSIGQTVIMGVTVAVELPYFEM